MAKKKQWTAAEMGKKGGPARMRGLTAEERKELARKAAQARWAKEKGEK